MNRKRAKGHIKMKSSNKKKNHNKYLRGKSRTSANPEVDAKVTAMDQLSKTSINHKIIKQSNIKSIQPFQIHALPLKAKLNTLQPLLIHFYIHDSLNYLH